MSAWLWAALLAAAQADGLIEKLKEEDVAARERASQALVELGPKARPALEKAAKTADPEIRARVRSILGEIELAERRGQALGGVLRVTLPDEELALGDVAARVQEGTGVTLRIPDSLRSARVRVEARETPLLEFVDRLCRAHGKLAPVPLDGGFELREGVPWTGPVGYSGPFRVWIDRLRLERRDPFGAGYARGSLVLALGWQPNVRPVSFGFSDAAEFRLTEIRTDGDVPLAAKEWHGNPHNGFGGGASHPRTARHFVPFEHPPKGARRLTIRGFVDVLLPIKLDTVVFARPLASVGQAVKSGDYQLTLKKCSAGAEGFVVLVRFDAPVEGPDVEKSQQRLELRSRFDQDRFELVDDAGVVHRGKSNLSSHASGSDADGQRTESHEQGVVFPAVAGARELRFPFLADYFERRVEFEFKDVELP